MSRPILLENIYCVSTLCETECKWTDNWRRVSAGGPNRTGSTYDRAEPDERLPG